jgi:hypothetical protein
LRPAKEKQKRKVIRRYGRKSCLRADSQRGLRLNANPNHAFAAPRVIDATRAESPELLPLLAELIRRIERQ